MSAISCVLMAMFQAMNGVSAELIGLDGQSTRLTAARFDPGWIVNGMADSTMVTRPARDLAAVRFAGKPATDNARGTKLLLANGDRLRADPVAADGDVLTARSAALGELKVSLSLIVGVQVDPDLPEDRLSRFLAETKPGSDRFLLKNGDIVAASLAGMDGEKFRVNRDNQESELSRDLVGAIAFDPSLLDAKPSRDFAGQLSLVDGSRLTLKSMVSEGDKIRLESAAFPDAKLNPADAVELTFKNGRLVYLSDLAPEATKIETFADDPMPPRMDRSALGAPLRLGGRTYPKGIGVRGRTTLAYNVAGFSRFETLAGMDESAGAWGSARFEVRIDGKIVFDSGEMSAAQAPAKVSVTLKDASRLELVVDYAQRGDVRDFADWADARLVR